jgi:hypothetical protein
MDTLLFIIGCALLVVGLGYLFQPGLILRMNAFFRETLFKDSVVLLSNRRVGIVLLLISCILIALTLKVPQ